MTDEARGGARRSEGSLLTTKAQGTQRCCIPTESGVTKKGKEEKKEFFTAKDAKRFVPMESGDTNLRSGEKQVFNHQGTKVTRGHQGKETKHRKAGG